MSGRGRAEVVYNVLNKLLTVHKTMKYNSPSVDQRRYFCAPSSWFQTLDLSTFLEILAEDHVYIAARGAYSYNFELNFKILQYAIKL